MESPLPRTYCYFIVRSFDAERNICGDFALMFGRTRMSSDGVSGVSVTRDKGNADATGSSGDRNAEADGREIPRLRLYADLTYFPGYIDKSLYARGQHTYQPTTGIRIALFPVHLQDPQLPLEECLGPFRIPPEARHHFTNAIRNGEGFTIDIRHERLPRFDSEEFDERQFLHILINVLHHLISRHDIGLNYASIVRQGILCEENKLELLAERVQMQYLVSVIFPTGGTSVQGSIRCSCKCESLDGYDSRVEVACTVNGPLAARPNDIEFSPTGNVVFRSRLGTVGFASLLSCLREMRRSESTVQHFREVVQPNSLSKAYFKSNDDAIVAFTEAAKQAMAMLNIAFDPDTIQASASRAQAGGQHVELTIPPLGVERAAITVAFTRTFFDGFERTSRRKPASASGQAAFDEREWLEAPIFDIQLMVTCPDRLHFRIQQRFSTAPEDRYGGRIAYLQRCLHQRGLVATEMVVRDMLDAFRPDHGGRVQLLLQDAWSHHVAFVEQNKSKLLDMIEDTLRTAIALVRADFPSFQIELSDARRDYPHQKPLGVMRIGSQQNAEIDCIIQQDCARNIVLDISCYRSWHQRNNTRITQKNLGGIELARAAKVPAIQNESDHEDSEGNALGEEGGAPDDDSEEEDGVFEYGGSCPDLDTNSDTDSLETTSTAIGATRASAEVQPSTSSSFEHRLAHLLFFLAGGAN